MKLFYYFILYIICLASRFKQNLVLRYFLEALRIEWRNSTPRFALLLERESKNFLYLIFKNENRTHSMSRLYSHAAPRLPSGLFIIYLGYSIQ